MKRFDELRSAFEAAGYSIRAVSAQEGFTQKLATHKDGPIVLGYPVVEDIDFALTDEQGYDLACQTTRPGAGLAAVWQIC